MKFKKHMRDANNKPYPLHHHFSAKDDLMRQRMELPIYYGKKELISAVVSNDTIIVISETGSGKTTQLPQYLLEAQFARKGIIVCTQPRRVAAITVAERVAKEKNTNVGGLVGYCVRFEDVTSEQTRLKFVTDGMLLRESLLDAQLRKYSVVILDEAHERSLHTDVLFGVVKKAQRERPLKVIVMSATLNADHFSRYFNDAKVCYLEGRQHPIKIMYTEEVQKDYLHASLVSSLQIHRQAPPGDDILVFLTGQEEIEKLARLIQDITPHLTQCFCKLLVCPLFASLPSHEQLKAFSPSPIGYRKIILATNIAETSVTIPGVKYVVDCGMVKMKTHTDSLNLLKVQPVSKAQAHQRSGRAGRECPGICYRLYPEHVFRTLEESTVPEIKRCNLRSVVLHLLCLGLRDVNTFDFMDAPSDDAMRSALQQLVLLGAVEAIETQTVTPKGRLMCSFPLDPLLSSCILASRELNCTEEIVSVVALLCVDSLMYTASHQLEKSRKIRSKFSSVEGDHVSLLLFFRAYVHAKGNAMWCREHFVNVKSIKSVLQSRQQLRLLCTKLDIPLTSCANDYSKVRKALAAGLFLNGAERQKDGSYVTLHHRQTVHIHPSSVLFHQKPSFVVFNEVVQTSKSYMKTISIVEPQWLMQSGSFKNLLPHAVHS